MANVYDTVVIGGGPSGVAAAIAASRAGNKTILVERYGFAGGMATAGLVNPFAGNCYVNPETKQSGDLVEGIFLEVIEKLREDKAVVRCRFADDHNAFYDAFDETQLKILYDKMLKESGVEVLYHSFLLDAVIEKGDISSVTICTKDENISLYGKTFIDCTGDADLSFKSGVLVSIGRDNDGLCQPMTLMFRMGGIAKEGLLKDGLRKARLYVSKYFDQARSEGRLDYEFKPWVQFYDYPRDGALQFNMTRVALKSGLKSSEMSDAEIEGRRQAKYFTDWIKQDVKEFEKAFLETIGVQVGVRETRRISGQYQLTQEDILAGARFTDGIARSGYFIDIHPPTGVDDKKYTNSIGKIQEHLVPKQFYEIPYRCLLPKKGPTNLLVACRAISTSFEAHAATRVMATMHMVGEAAGLASQLSKELGCSVQELDGSLVREKIGYLDKPLRF